MKLNYPLSKNEETNDREGKMKKKKRIPLDEEANGLEKSKYRLAASPFPVAIATKKEETSVAKEGCVSLIAVRKVYKPVAKALRKRKF
ncbi:hypothetical protein K0M31_018422 [Melipona bicolor]|uniref:Uncharacterized protein n=1 Tax=Melipona bicolor TaxID=60889 RepID=A0AA40KRK4_9HYME|nr:hypothetical protein K0M31_018422 [Melipona bicolor]